MARTPIPVTGITKAGVDAPTPVTGDPTGGHSVANPDGDTVLLVRNTGGAAHTLAVRITITVDGLPVNPRVVTVPAGQTLLLGYYPREWYGTTLLLDPETSDLRISALRLGESIGVPTTGPFTASGLTVIADLAATGLTVDGNILIVDTGLTSSTVDGSVLVVTTI